MQAVAGSDLSSRRLEKQVRQRDAFFTTNEQFHMASLRIAGNRWCQQILADLRKVLVA